MAKQVDKGLLEKALAFALSVSVPEEKAYVVALREQYPNESNEELAHRVFNKTSWKALVSGVATGAPSNILVALPAAVADAGVVLTAEVKAAARVALIYDPAFLDLEDSELELLVPILGIGVISQALRGVAVKAGQQLTRKAIREYLSKGALVAFRKIAMKYLGEKVTQKAVLTKTVPLIGAIIGGTWNWIEVGIIKRRTIKYFSESAEAEIEPNRAA